MNDRNASAAIVKDKLFITEIMSTAELLCL